MIEKALEELAKATSANTAAIVALTAAMSGSKVAAAVKSEKAATEKPPKAADKSGKPEKASKAEEYTGDDLDEDEEGAEDDEQEVEEEPAPKAKKPAAKAEAAAKPDKNEATLADVKAAFVAYLGYGKTDDEDHTKEYDKRHAAMTKFCASCDKEADRPSKLSEEHWTKAVKWAKSKLAELAEEV